MTRPNNKLLMNCYSSCIALPALVRRKREPAHTKGHRGALFAELRAQCNFSHQLGQLQFVELMVVTGDTRGDEHVS